MRNKFLNIILVLIFVIILEGLTMVEVLAKSETKALDKSNTKSIGVEETKKLEVSETRGKKMKHSYNVEDAENALVYGNFTLEDETGSVLVYGLTATKQSYNDKSFATLNLKEGDKIVSRIDVVSVQAAAQSDNLKNPFLPSRPARNRNNNRQKK